jgi:anti-anti-sigma regulatory factor
MKQVLEPMTREGHSIVPSFEGRKLILKLSGTFDMTSAAALQIYLGQVGAEIRTQQLLELLVDVTEVYYLGSSCIKAFVTLTVSIQHGSAGTLLRILTNPRLDWQDRAFAVLTRLAPGRVVVEQTI